MLQHQNLGHGQESVWSLELLMEASLVETLKALFDLGGVVVVTIMLYLVWQRLNDVTDNLIDILKELRVQGLIVPPKDETK